MAENNKKLNKSVHVNLETILYRNEKTVHLVLVPFKYLNWNVHCLSKHTYVMKLQSILRFSKPWLNTKTDVSL